MGKFLQYTPLRIDSLKDASGNYFILKVCTYVSWSAGLISPSEWILSLFKITGSDGRVHTRPTPIEVYAIVLLLLSFVPLFSFNYIEEASLHRYDNWIGAACFVFVVDVFRANIFKILIRPSLNPKHKVYSPTRTLVLAMFSYATTAVLFANLYLYKFPCEFNDQLTASKAFSLSVGIITTSGVSGISPSKHGLIFIITSIEAFVGVLFVSTIIALALSRYNDPGLRTTDESRSGA